MKRNFIFTLIISTLLSSCSVSSETQIDDVVLSSFERQKINKFEDNYINNNRMLSRTANGIYLIGYKSVKYKGRNRDIVNDIWKEYKTAIESHGSFLTLDGVCRVYCPLKNAIVSINGKEFHADSCGFIKDINLSDKDEILVLGRDKTERSVLTIFKNKLSPTKKMGTSLIFDLGEKNLSHSKHATKLLSRSEGHEEEEEEGGVSCVSNHDNYPNCTYAFDCYQGRCTLLKTRCMDYNGFGTDCSGSKKFFLGSDCSVAMATGHCWNEVMD